MDQFRIENAKSSGQGATRKELPSRRGALVVCTLVCLLVASTIVTAMTQMALRARRNVIIEQQMRQTQFLLDAGILRAVRQVRASAEYDGESWRPSGAITRFEGAIVEIRVTVDPQQPDNRQIEVHASLGVAADDAQETIASRTRCSHAFQIEAENTDSPNTESPNTNSPNADSPDTNSSSAE